MIVIYKCGEQVVNQHSETKRYGCENPFGDVLPVIGDFIQLGEHTSEFKHLEYTPMVTYVVKSRTFSAIENYNNSYKDITCIIEVEEVIKKN